MLRARQTVVNETNKYHKRRANAAKSTSFLNSNKFAMFGVSICFLGFFSLFPIWILERDHTLISESLPLNVKDGTLKIEDSKQKVESPVVSKGNSEGKKNKVTDERHRSTKDGRILPNLHLHELDTNLDAHSQDMPVARGVAGSPLEETPALVGAVRAHIDCDINVDSLAYWNDPIGTRDQNFVSPFDVMSETKYISFAPDRGGWNNVRMSMEIIFVIAAATGRTLILPPKEPLYLLHHDAAARHRGFADFFPIHTAEFQKRVKVISFAEFLERENDGPLAPKKAELKQALNSAADHCDKRDNSENACGPVFEYLKTVGYNAEVSATNSCLVFDESKYNGGDPSDAVQEQIDLLCGPKRTQVFWEKSLQQHQIIHFRASEKNYRLLTHFYGMIHFTDPAIDHYYKRFVRDFLHYHDSIYCAAGKIVKAVQKEGMDRGFLVDSEGAGAYSAMHVRRGDLQYKKVKISAQEWYDNTKEVWRTNEILYIATDERDKSFFTDLAKHHDLRFLDDYWDFAGLGDLDPNYMGMIDTIVASRGRAFAGTWFSTFSGYIIRLRGYHGMTLMDAWYSFLPKKTAMHEWKIVDDFVYAYEWPDGWIDIDKDEWPTRDKF